MDSFPIHDVSTSKPPEDHNVRVWLADGSQEAAVWTGKGWWTYRGAVEAVRWQEMPGAPHDAEE